MPLRPSASVLGEFRVTSTKLGVMARLQTANMRFLPRAMPALYSPSNVVPASISTTLPSIE